MKIDKILPLFLGLLGLALLIMSFMFEQIFLMIIGALVLLLSIFVLAFFMIISLYQKDQEFNPEELQKQGLTLFNCTHCNTQNVLEDKYCRNCGETLEE